MRLNNLLRHARNLWSRNPIRGAAPSLGFGRPMVLLQSDDWGRVGVRDRDGFEQLRAAGLSLGEVPYDFYTLETAENVGALRELLLRHRDSIGRPPCIVMNFITANLDFQKMAADGFQKIHLLALADGLPGAWRRPGLIEAYRQGIADGVFYPALHGATHFCAAAVEEQLAIDSERRQLLRALWQAETPYIHWRMPWVGYEYWHPERSPRDRFLSAETQDTLIHQAAGNFRALFGTAPASACAPGYRANSDTCRAWMGQGVRVAQNGPGSSAACYMDKNEMLQLFRNLEFEPATTGPAFSVGECLRVAEANFSCGKPLIVSLHSINFHSTLKDFCSPTLAALDRFLEGLELRHPELLYVHDVDLHQCVTHGSFEGLRGAVKVTVTQTAAKRGSL